ncbi:MAG: sigma-70 family RNA polymerase sigma factor [Acidobacteriota bacterium]|nr:sigma-70 family RNA polymerase sigma factor [Acidobacteriota bacterium]
MVDKTPSPTDEPETGPTTRLLQEYQNGSRTAFDQLFAQNLPLLEQMAKYILHNDAVHDFMQTGSLVNEYCLKLIKQKEFTADDSKAFRGFAFRGMRQIVLDKARRRKARIKTVPREQAPEPQDRAGDVSSQDHKIWLEDALDEAAPGMGILAALKHAGFTNEEMADILGTSATDISRKWSQCKRILSAKLQRK